MTTTEILSHSIRITGGKGGKYRASCRCTWRSKKTNFRFQSWAIAGEHLDDARRG